MANSGRNGQQPSRRVERAISDGLDRWQASERDLDAAMTALLWEEPAQAALQRRLNGHGLTPSADPTLRSLPRRRQVIDTDAGDPPIPQIEEESIEVSFWRVLGRLFHWLYLILYVTGGNGLDRLLRRQSVEREAVRLRRGLERVGGTFVKFGQQIAMRIDLVPWEYSIELSKMLDKMPPFPLEKALEAVARATGKPWQETFAVFDPEPVGSASVACVYQGILKDGTKVAVKVRRPGIGELFVADFRVMGWLFNLVEFLTIVRPGFTTNVRTEFANTLLEELDFRKEARFQDIFRRRAKKSGKKYFSAPKVFFEYSSDEVIVEEFVSGIWLWEVIGALEQQDQRGLALLRENNIDPSKLARRILWSCFWSMDENLFFHADPHPANIVIQPNNEFMYIDFGSCGSFNDEQKGALEKIVLARLEKDVEKMARATLGLLEPLPPIDLPALMRVARAEFTKVLYTFETKSKHTEWWERTSARLWVALIQVARQFDLPMNLHTLRMIRATLLYDTLVLRLDNRVDRFDEYRSFMDDRARLARRRWGKRLEESMGSHAFLRVAELMETGEELFNQAQRLVGTPIFQFGAVVDKWAFAVSVLSRMGFRLFVLTLLGLAVVAFTLWRAGEPITLAATATRVFTNLLYQLGAAAIIILNVRHILYRLQDRDG